MTFTRQNSSCLCSSQTSNVNFNGSILHVPFCLPTTPVLYMHHLMKTLYFAMKFILTTPCSDMAVLTISVIKVYISDCSVYMALPCKLSTEFQVLAGCGWSGSEY